MEKIMDKIRKIGLENKSLSMPNVWELSSS